MSGDNETEKRRAAIKAIKALLAELETVEGAKDLVESLRYVLNIDLGYKYLEKIGA